MAGTRYLTIKDVAAELQVKPSTLYAWIGEGKIPFIKLHRLVRFRREDIEGWVQSLRRQAVVPEKRVNRRRRNVETIDGLIARAKADVYTPGCGKPDQDRANGKEATNGSVSTR